MFKRIAVLGVLAAGVLGFAAGPASAAQYPPHANIVTVNSPCPGAEATISGSVAGADGTPLGGATVNLTLDGATVGTPVSDSAGKFTVSFTAPTQQGEHPVTAQATLSDSRLTPEEKTGPVVNASLKVVSCEAAPSAPRPDLPRTGSSDSTMTMVKVGVGLAAFGAALLAVAQKRRRRTSVA